MASIDDLWLVDFGEPYPGEPAYYRPSLVLGPPDTFGPDFPFVTVAPLTTTRRGLSVHVEVEATESSGLDETGYIQCELIRSINVRRLVHRLGAVELATRQDVTDVVRMLLDH
jgi:mRNA-degrading endonuclease toxin of MazEF toxin-antitoxin module